MNSGGGSRHVGAPRTLQVQQFANARGVEVQSLHAVLKDKKAQDAIPRCLRRRTTSHNRRKSFFWQRKTGKKRKPDEAPVNEGVEIEEAVKRPLCRRVRRKIELKGDGRGGGGCSRDGTQRLVTHVWHAKRFTMTKLWGHWLAEGLPGRGRGSRAVLRWKNEAAVLHDASYYSAIELEGSGKSILEALQAVLEPAPPRSVELMSQKDQSVYSGAEYGKSMLHHMGRFPRGAIAPVTYIWRRESNAGEERRIWLWVHAGAFEEALACLQLLCRSQGIHEKDKLQCWSRKGQLGRLDLLGSKAMSVLQKVLHPVARQEGDVDARVVENNDQFPAGAVMEMEVWDPRCRPDSDTTFEPAVLLDAGSDENGVEVMESKRLSTFNQLNVDSSNIWGPSGPTRQESTVMALTGKDLSIRRHKKRLSYLQLSEDTQEDLTGSIGNLKCSIMVLKHDDCGFSLLLPIGWVRAFWVPLVFAGGHVVGLRERHWLHTDAKLPSFPDDYPDCYSYDQHMVEKSAEYQETFNRRPPSKRGLWKSEVLGWEFVHEASGLDSGNRDVSIADFGGETSCDTVAADSVSKTINDGLTSTGPEARLAQPNICSSAQHAVSGVATVTENSLTDLSKPSSDALVSLPQRDLSAQTIASDVEGDYSVAPVGILHEAQRYHNVVTEPSPHPDPTPSSQPISGADLEEPAASKRGETGESSMCVARTRGTLQKILRDCSLDHLPLLSTSSEDGHPASQLAEDGTTELLKKGCLVRVLICAPRKGVFDEGAIIYLPLPADVDSYFCSSPKWQGFEDRSFKQVQQSRKKSCEGVLLETRSECCSLRVPMGIITSGSVRGSASIAAIGTCEVAGLGVLRARQMADKRWPSLNTSEIFLLVRNKCSSMYRPALASIVVETSDDLE